MPGDDALQEDPDSGRGGSANDGARRKRPVVVDQPIIRKKQERRGWEKVAFIFFAIYKMFLSGYASSPPRGYNSTDDEVFALPVVSIIRLGLEVFSQ